ncbi:SCL-interrupting protein [Gossypium arboreum]|uniref:SCL-interrupting protein n=1 Tax=Gossypium arboreum TaxID=29729 RepID=A0A0B0Q329_GOSAR|nr:SCL-interrupting protein [Gossypium arboreum]
MMSGLSPEGFVLINKSGLSPKAFVQVTKPGLSPEGIRASHYNRASSRRHLSESLYPVKFRRYVIRE